MKKGNGAKMIAERKERAEKLFEAIASGKLSDELLSRLHAWLMSIPEESIEEEALADWAAKNLKPDTAAPTEKEKDSFVKLTKLLHIEKIKKHANAARRALFPGRGFMPRAAAVLLPTLIAVGATFFIYKYSQRNTEAAVENFILYADHESGREAFTLPDGSNVTLENGSSLAYTSEFGASRRVKLNGEALFDVAHDEANPFSVNHDGFSVTVLGTVFNVKAHDNIDEAEIVLISGKVAVEVGQQRRELSPGERLKLDKSKLSIMEHSALGSGAMMKVLRNDIKIEDTHAVGALSIIADYFNRVLIIEDGLVSDDRLSIILPGDITPEAAIATMNRLSENAKCHIDSDTIYVSKK